MLESLDILIGFSVVMLIFSLAVAAILQSLLSLMQMRGWNLLRGIASLLRQIDPTLDRTLAREIAAGIVRHPTISRGRGQLGSVVQRAELIQLLLGLAADEEPRNLDPRARDALSALLKKTGIQDPAASAKDIRATALQLELAQPELAAHVRNSMAIIQEASSDFVAKVHGWFDSTMERVSQEFTSQVRILTGIVAFFLVFALQLNAFEVLNHLAIDKELRAYLLKTGEVMVRAQSDSTDAPRTGQGMVQETSSQSAPTEKSETATNRAQAAFDSSIAQMRQLAAKGLVTLPKKPARLRDWMKWDLLHPGILLSAVLVALGAPFWFRILKGLLNLRSTLAAKEDAERTDRREQPPAEAGRKIGGRDSGEAGDLAPVG